jgi:hypothetical protein
MAITTKAQRQLVLRGYSNIDAAAPAGGATPKGVFGLPFHGPFAGAIYSLLFLSPILAGIL